MKYKVALQRSEEGISVSVPGLPGCWSQGAPSRRRWRISEMPFVSIWLSPASWCAARRSAKSTSLSEGAEAPRDQPPRCRTRPGEGRLRCGATTQAHRHDRRCANSHYPSSQSSECPHDGRLRSRRRPDGGGVPKAPLELSPVPPNPRMQPTGRGGPALRSGAVFIVAD